MQDNKNQKFSEWVDGEATDEDEKENTKNKEDSHNDEENNQNEEEKVKDKDKFQPIYSLKKRQGDFIKKFFKFAPKKFPAKNNLQEEFSDSQLVVFEIDLSELNSRFRK